MSAIDPDLARMGDQLQVRWRVDARRARVRRRAGLLGTALAAALAIAGGAIAGGILPIHLTATSGTPSPAALAQLRGVIAPTPAVPKPWKHAPHLLLQRAIVIGTVTGRATGTLSVFVVPIAPRGVCVDAARHDGSSYLEGCTDFPQHATTALGTRVAYFQVGVGFLGSARRPAIEMVVREAPPGAVRVDVRDRDGSRRAAILNHGWMVSLNPHPDGPTALVRFYDAAGTRILSFDG
jgi:hypothetical protein